MTRFIPFGVIICVSTLSLSSGICAAQANSGSSSWSSTTQQNDPTGNVNPSRTTQTHSENGGRVVDKTTVETVGPDGHYVPYSDREKEAVRVDANTVRTIERTYGRGPDGQRTLIQQSETETRTLTDGGNRTIETTSNPDANGRLQTIRRETTDSKQVSAGVTQTSSTVFSPDADGRMSPVVRVQAREKKNEGGGVEFSKSTLLSDGAGHWSPSEVREGTIQQQSGQDTIRQERVMRPDSNGNLMEVERTVSRQAAGPGETRETTETYSTNVPGVAGNDQLQLVGRETIVQQKTSAGGQTTTRRSEALNSGNPESGLRVTQQAIDIVRPDGRGSADQKGTTVFLGPDGQVNAVLVDMGKTSNPSAVQVDTRSASKAK